MKDCLLFLKMLTFLSDGLNYVWSLMLDLLKPKICCLNLITYIWTRSSLFGVQKNDFRVGPMSNLVKLSGSMFNIRLFEAKNKVSEFNHQ